MTFQLISLLATTLFASASFYVSFVEHPARMMSDTTTALTQWRPSFKRAAAMQIILTLITCITSMIAFTINQSFSVLLGGIVLSLVVPYTLIVIMPINRILLSEKTLPQTPSTRALLEKWGKLHNLRTIISSLSLAIQFFNLLF
jgi:hypothetical protein